jgi:hypothetical protein
MYPVLFSALDAILVVTIRSRAETYLSVIHKMTHGIDLTVVMLLHTKHVNFTDKDLKSGIDNPEKGWYIHPVSYDTLTSTAKPSYYSQFSYSEWSLGNDDQYHPFQTNNSMGWQIEMNTKIGLKHNVTVLLGFHSLHNW